MDSILEELTKEWIKAIAECRLNSNDVTRYNLEMARAQMQAAALIVLAVSAQKLVLYTNQVIDGNESIHVTQEGDW